MAIYRQGPLAGAISGAVGGVVFVNSRGSAVVRHRPATLHKRRSVIARNSNSPRAAFPAAVAGWRALGDAARLAWIALASQTTFPNRLGQLRQITGYQLYVKVNILRGNAAAAPMTVAPGTTRPIPLNSLVVTADTVAGLDVTVDSPVLPATRLLLTYGAVHFGGSVTSYFRDFHFLGAIVFTRAASQDIIVEWETVFGPLVTGQNIALRFIPWLFDTYPATPWTQATKVT